MTSEQRPSVEVEQCTSESQDDDGGHGWRQQSAQRRRRKRRGVKSTGAAALKRVLEAAGYYVTRKPGSNAETCLVSPRLLFEEHHHTYGMPWALGRDHADQIRSSGLEPHHKLLDFGCGALRVGVWLIPFLDTGNYFGLDAHAGSLEAAAEYEIPLHGLEDKKPRLLLTKQSRCDHFGTRFDRVVALSVLNHMGAELARPALARISSTMAVGGRLLATERIPVPDEEIEAQHGLVLESREQVTSRFVKGSTLWQSYRLVRPA